MRPERHLQASRSVRRRSASSSSAPTRTAATSRCGSPTYRARPVRARVQVLRAEPFVEAARAQGFGRHRVLATELLPDLAFTIIAVFTVLFANAVVLESALAFLGARVRPPEPSWGSLLRTGISHASSSPHLLLLPAAAITLTVLAINMVGESIRHALDPRAPVRAALGS